MDKLDKVIDAVSEVLYYCIAATLTAPLLGIFGLMMYELACRIMD